MQCPWFLTCEKRSLANCTKCTKPEDFEEDIKHDAIDEMIAELREKENDDDN